MISHHDGAVKKQIHELSKSIRKKYLALKLGKSEEDSALNKLFKPIVEPLNSISDVVVGNKPNILEKGKGIPPSTSVTTPTRATATKRKLVFNSSEKVKSSLQKQVEFLKKETPNPNLNTTTTDDDDDDYEDIENPDDDDYDDDVHESTRKQLIKSQTYRDYLANNFTTPLPRKYIEERLSDTKNEFDINFGIDQNLETGKFSIGDSVLDFKGPDIIVYMHDDKSNTKIPQTYIGTSGLYELLFKKQPIGYTDQDVARYMDIGYRTNLFRRNYSAFEQINGNNTSKYRNIIKPNLGSSKKKSKKTNLGSSKKKSKKKKGGSLPIENSLQLQHNSKPIEYVYFDDVNELVDRLRLLIASKDAGNTSHDNEIISIINELREASVIY